ncbi:D-aminoacyl-tRNA deacylase, partial [Zeaxanthinibacter enoshimensis]
MRAVVQRVSRAGVTVEGEQISAISGGLLILLGVEEADTREDITWLSRKIANLRIFNDEDGVMNRSLLE